MRRFDIAGIHIEIITENLHIIDKFKPFISCFEGATDLIVTLKSCDHINKPGGSLLQKTGNIEWFANPDMDNVTVCINNWVTNEPLCLLISDFKWSSINISYIKDSPDIDYAVTGIMFNIIIRNHVLFHQGIVIHASAIDYNGKGIIFSAPSGTGKSTQASLWENNMGAKVLNDDCPVVKIENENIIIYGTPCSGSKDKFLNSKAPLSTIVVLEQDSQNTICSLSSIEAVSYLMPRCFLAYNDINLMEMAIKNFEKIICTVPIYLLKCRPDMEAVELVYQCIQ